MICLSRRKTELRRIVSAAFSVVLTLAVFLGTLPAGSPEFSIDPASGNHAASEFINYDKSVPKPCRKALLPGALNPCPLSAFSLVAIPADEPDHTVARQQKVAHWSVKNIKLYAQCDRFSPYRPPCPSV